MPDEFHAAIAQAYESAFKEMKQREAMRTQERSREAGALLTSILKADDWTPQRLQLEGKNHDLDLKFDSEKRHAVEVTRSVSSYQATFESIVKRRDDSNDLTGHWTVEVEMPSDASLPAKRIGKTAGAHAGRINDNLERLLTDLEVALKCSDAWPAEFTPYRISHLEGAAKPLTERFEELQVVRLWCTPEPTNATQGSFTVTQHVPVSNFGPSNFTAEVKRQIRLKHEQLMSAQRQHEEYVATHLFIWLPLGREHDWLATAVALNANLLPMLPTNIDRMGINSVWVAVQDGNMSADTDDRLPHERLDGFSQIVWQLDSAGWHYWRKEWVRHETPESP